MVVPSAEYLMLCLNGILLLDEDSYLCIFSIPDHLRAILLMKKSKQGVWWPHIAPYSVIGLTKATKSQILMMVKPGM